MSQNVTLGAVNPSATRFAPRQSSIKRISAGIRASGGASRRVFAPAAFSSEPHRPCVSRCPKNAAGTGALPPNPDIGASRPSIFPKRRAPRTIATDAADAAAEAPAAPQEPPNTFAIGISWFFAHQLVGVANDVIMKYMGQNLGVSQVVFMRFLFATLSMLPVMLSTKGSFKTSRVPLHIARSLLLAGGIWLYVLGLSIAPIAVVTTLNFTIPLFTLVFATVFLKEKVELVRWGATLIGFAGVMVVLQPGAMAFNPQWMCVLISASMFAGLDVLNKKFVGEESFWAMIFYTALFTALITAAPAAMSWVTPTLSQCGLLAVLGGGANGLLYCLLKSFSYIEASALAPFRYTELLLSAAVGFLIFAEVPASSTLLGALIIVPSTLFVVWQENRRKKNDSSS